MPRQTSRLQKADTPSSSFDLLTEREVRARIRVSRATLDRWVKEGAFPKFLKLHEGGSEGGSPARSKLG